MLNSLKFKGFQIQKTAPLKQIELVIFEKCQVIELYVQLKENALLKIGILQV